MGLGDVMARTVEDWPDVPLEVEIAIWSVPGLAFLAAVVWLRVLWPVDKDKKEFDEVSMLETDGTAPAKETTALSSASQGPSYGDMEGARGTNEVTPALTPPKDLSPGFAPPGVAYSQRFAVDPTTESPAPVLNSQVSGDEAWVAWNQRPTAITVIEAGEVAGDYSADWKGTFDMMLLLVMIAWLGVNILATSYIKPALFGNSEFWILQVPKLSMMILVSVFAGSLCRHFCPVDENGYIFTSKNSWFKVNYTRKVQHFAAYIVPLIFPTSAECDCTGTLELSWGVWVTLIGFLVMIKPIRESIPLFMLQFNGLDRPEDRPYTLEWIVKYNIWPGELLIILFSHLFLPSGQRDLVYIIVFVTGVGDGLAEPVGIWLGKHKYMARSCESSTYYQRSYEGSMCVFLVTIITVICVHTTFATFWQFLAALLTLPLALTLAEAFSPHTMDTPFIMGVGGAMIYAIILTL